MFNREEDSATNANTETIIGPSVKVNGNFTGSGNVNVEGSVTGTLKTTKNLRVGEAARIKADISAESVYVAGEIRGNVVCKGKLELTSSARVIGNVETQTLTVAAGAVLNGKCQMLENDNKEENATPPVEDINKKGKNHRK
jgi:cytoskeletal protein CcmA (bactofilin family)